MLQVARVVERLVVAPQAVLLLLVEAMQLVQATSLVEAAPLVVLESRLVLLGLVLAGLFSHIPHPGTVQLIDLRIHNLAVIQQTPGSAASVPITVHLALLQHNDTF